MKDRPSLTSFLVVVDGTDGVGKTSLVFQFIHEYFPEDKNPWIGENCFKQFVLDGRHIKVESKSLVISYAHL